METWEDTEDWNGTSLFWALGALCLVLLVAAWRVHSYLVAQEPYLQYFPLAQNVVEANWSLASIQQIGQTMAPGYPLILANLLEVLGPYASWVNTGFGLLWISSLGLLLWRVTRSSAAAILGTLAWFPMFMLGDTLIPHFFLHPFGDGPAQVLVLLALLALVLLPKRSLPLVSGCLLVLACVIREVAIVGFPVAAVAIWMCVPATRLHQKGLRLLGLFAPLVGALIVAGLLFGLSLQHVGALFGFATSGGFDAGAGILAGLFRGPLWFVLPAFGLGVFALARVPSLWVWLVLPAVLTLALYATHSFETRYLMTVLLWLAPLPGVGIWAMLRHLPEDHRSHTAGLLALVFLLVSAVIAARLEPWGPVVSRGDVDAFQAEVNGQLERSDLVVPCRGCLTGRAAIDSYTSVKRGDLNNIEGTLDRQGLFVLHALTPEAVDGPASGDRFGLRISEVARRRHDLVPLQSAAPLKLGPAVYQLLQVRPWTDQGRSNPVTLMPGQANWVLLDFRGQAAAVSRTIELRAADTSVLYAWDASGLSGLQLLRVPARSAIAPTLDLHAISSQPGPRAFVVASTPATKPITFDGTDYRFLSMLDWFEGEGWLRGSSDDKFGMSLFGEGELVIPLPIGMRVGAAHVHVEFHCHPGAKGSLMEVWHGDSRLAQHPMGSGSTRNLLRLVVPSPSGNELRLRFKPLDVEAFPLSSLKTLWLQFDPVDGS